MSISALIRRMSDAGASPEAIAIAVEEIEAIQDSLNARRAADRDRKRAQRERQKTANVTGQSGDSHETVTPMSGEKVPSEVSPHTPLPTNLQTSPLNPPVVLEEKAAAVGSCLRRAFPAELELPEWWPADTYAEFRSMRKRMRNVPFEPGAERRLVAKVVKLKAEGHDPEKLLSKAIENGHRTVFPDETTKATGASGKVELTAQQWRERAEVHIRFGRHDNAEECRRKAIQLEQRATA